MNPFLVWTMARKEFRHILRDGQTLGMILSLPVVMMFLFGYALKSEIEDARIVLIDPSPSPESSSLAKALDASSAFDLVAVERGGDPADWILHHRARAVLRIENRYAQNLHETPVVVGAWFDGSDPSTATTLRSALPGILRTHLGAELRTNLPTLIQVDTRFLYNPEQRSSMFFVPGLMATILAMISALLTSITVTREKELGTLANLRLSRLHSLEIILGKLLPYFIIASITGILIMGVGRIAFGVVINGSVPFLVIATVSYLITNLALGLLISTLVKRQQHAMLGSLGITMMPVIMLSGFIFPVTSLPAWLQYLSKIIPATWYLQLVRGIVLKATDPSLLATPLLVLTGMGFFLIVVATIRFRREQ